MLKKIGMKFHINSVIELFLLSDFLLSFSTGLLTPIFAVYVTQQITGGDLRVVGLASTVYWIVRCVISAPLGRYMDKKDGEKDEYYFMLFGSVLTIIIPLLYITASQIWHVYLFQALYGLAHAVAVPGWRILFTNHLDSGQIGYEWSLDDIFIGLSIAIGAYLGASIAEWFGFTILFVAVSTASFMGTLLLLPIRHEIKSRKQVLKVRRRRRAAQAMAEAEKG